MTDLHVSLIAHQEDNEPSPLSLPWPALVEVLSSPVVRENKLGPKGWFSPGYNRAASENQAPLFNLARYRPTNTGGFVRKDTFVVESSGFVLDFDDWPDGQGIDGLLSRFDGLTYFAHTSFSHDPTKGAHKWRVVLPFDHPLPAGQHKAAWRWLELSLAPFILDACKSANHFFFLPACPQERISQFETRIGEGARLSLPSFDELKRGIPPAQPIVGTKVDWPFLRERLRRYNKDPELRSAFLAVLSSKPFGRVPKDGQPGNRDILLTRMAGVLAGMALQADPSELAKLFAPSLVMMEQLEPSDPPPDLANCENKIARAQAGLRAKRADSPNAPVPAAERKAQNKDTLVPIAEERGLSADDFSHALIVQKGVSYFIWHPDTADWCGPLVKDEARHALGSWWRNMPGVDLEREKKDGSSSPRTFDSLFSEHGTVLDSVVYDLRASESRYDPAARELRAPGAPRRRIVAERGPPVLEAWLAALGGDKHERLLDWIATLLMLDLPTSILFLRGKKGSGKNLLARGLSRIWRVDNATAIKGVVGEFQAGLTKCPLVLLDEAKWSRFADPTAELRRLVTEPSRTVNQKYASEIPLDGHIRIIVTVNNFNIFRQRDAESLTPDDRDAIAQRFFEVRPDSQEAERILLSLPRRERDALASEDIIAKHALWLAETREVALGDRMLVEGDPSGRFAAEIVMNDRSWGSWVTEWIARWLSDPACLDGSSSAHLVWRGDGRALVNPEAVVNTYGLLVKNKINPQALDISDALRSLARDAKPVEFPAPNPRGTSGFDIRWEDVVEWAQEKQIGNTGLIRTNVMAARVTGPSGAVRHATRPISAFTNSAQ